MPSEIEQLPDMTRISHICIRASLVARQDILSMKTLTLLLCLTLAVTTGCMRPPTILSLAGEHTVNFPRVGELLHRKKKLVVIFLHGVGDHCPLYALDEKRGWISESAFRPLDHHSPGSAHDRVETPLYVSAKDFKALSFGQSNPRSV
jgi:hypothetical protein